MIGIPSFMMSLIVIFKGHIFNFILVDIFFSFSLQILYDSTTILTYFFNPSSINIKIFAQKFSNMCEISRILVTPSTSLLSCVWHPAIWTKMKLRAIQILVSVFKFKFPLEFWVF